MIDEVGLMNEELSEISKTCAEIRNKFETIHYKFQVPVILGVPNDDESFKLAFSWINYNLNKIIIELERRK